MTATDVDRSASDVAWDLEPLVDGRGEAGVDEHLEDAGRRADALVEYRGRVGDLDAAGTATLLHELAAITEMIGRAGSYAGLRFAVDTTDPARGALLAKVEELATAISNELIFVELEWAAGPTSHVAAILDDPDARLLSPPPPVGAPLSLASALRARGTDPRRQGGDGCERLVAAVQRADGRS